MYVCICNGIREKQVREAVNDGARTVGKVFKSQGCKADCAKCTNCIKNVIQEECQSAMDLMMAAE